MKMPALLFAMVLLVPVAGLHGSALAAEPAIADTLKGGPELPGSAVVADDAQRVAAAVLWDAMNAQPQNLRRSSELLRTMEEDVARLRQLSRQQQLEMADFPERVADIRALPWDELAYAALALLLALTAAVKLRGGMARPSPQRQAPRPATARSVASQPAVERAPAPAKPAPEPAPSINPTPPRRAPQDEAVRDEIRKAQERVARVRAEREAAALRLKQEQERVVPVVEPPPVVVPRPVTVLPPVSPAPKTSETRPAPPAPQARPAPSASPASPASPVPSIAAPSAPKARVAAQVPSPKASKPASDPVKGAGAAPPPQPLVPSSKVQALQVACRQAEAFLQRGDSKSAIAALSDHILGRTEAAPMAYLQLLDMYRRLGLREEYEGLSVVFLCVFEHAAPEMAVTGFRAQLTRDDSLLAHAWLLKRLTAAWPRALPTLALIEDLLFRHPGIDHTLLSVDAYRELLGLYELRLAVASLDGVGH